MAKETTLEEALAMVEQIIVALRQTDKIQRSQYYWLNLRIALSHAATGTDAWLLLTYTYYVVRYKKPITAKERLLGVTQLLRRFPRVHIADWGPEQIAAIVNANQSDSTKRCRLSACTSFIRYIRGKLKIEHRHWHAWRRARVYKRLHNVEILLASEIQQLLRYLGQRSRHGAALMIAAILAAFWGLRAREIAHLTLGDVIVSSSITLIVRGKGDKRRQIPAIHIPEEIERLVLLWWQHRQQLDNQPTALFIGLACKAIEGQIANALRAIRPTQGNQKSISLLRADSTHHLRHWFVNRIRILGTNLATDSRIVGHATPATTCGNYVHTCRTRADQCAGQLSDPVPPNTLATLAGFTPQYMRRLRHNCGQVVDKQPIPIKDAIAVITSVLSEHIVTSKAIQN